MKTNDKRVVLGGLTAGGVLLLGSLTAGRLLGYELAVAMFGSAHPSTGLQNAYEFIAYVTFHLAIGVALVWLYAAIRPRFGAGPITALRAAFLGWWFAVALAVPFQLAGGVFNPALVGGTVIATMAASAALYSLAAVTGAWLYGEAPEAAPAPAATADAG